VSQSRRGFLTAAAVGAAALGAGPLTGFRSARAAVAPDGIRYRTLRGTNARIPVYSESTTPYGFVQGTVQSIDSRSGLVIVSDGRQEQRFIMDQGTSAWKGEDVSLAAVERGDFLYVKTDGGGSGARALELWANIGWSRGAVASASPNLLRVDTPAGRHHVTVTSSTLVFEPGGAASSWHGQARAGDFAECLGVFTAPGALTATRIWC
jgi:hypothetical protein